MYLDEKQLIISRTRRGWGKIEVGCRMSEMRGRGMIEVRCQKSDGRNQMSEVGGQGRLTNDYLGGIDDFRLH